MFGLQLPMTLTGTRRDEHATARRAVIRGTPAGWQAGPVRRRTDFAATVQSVRLVTGAAPLLVLLFLLAHPVPPAKRLSNAGALVMLGVICWRLDQQMQDGR